MLIVRLLLEHNVNVNLANTKGDTPLHYCVRMNRKDLVVDLLLAHADITIHNNQDKTPFDIAIEEHVSNEIVTLLSNTQGAEVVGCNCFRPVPVVPQTQADRIHPK